MSTRQLLKLLFSTRADFEDAPRLGDCHKFLRGDLVEAPLKVGILPLFRLELVFGVEEGVCLRNIYEGDGGMAIVSEVEF